MDPDPLSVPGSRDGDAADMLTVPDEKRLRPKNAAAGSEEPDVEHEPAREVMIDRSSLRTTVGEGREKRKDIKEVKNRVFIDICLRV